MLAKNVLLPGTVSGNILRTFTSETEP
jgi:hypothetical protein